MKAGFGLLSFNFIHLRRNILSRFQRDRDDGSPPIVEPPPSTTFALESRP